MPSFGSGKIGTALARVFARKNIEVAIANSREPESLVPLAREIGPNILPQHLRDACEAELLFLAVPFPAHEKVARTLELWDGKIIVDVTNAFRVSPEALGGLLSSQVIAQSFVGARLVKAFNHLPAEKFGTNREIDGQRQVVFLSSDDASASADVAALAAMLGFAPVELGRLDQGGMPLHVQAGRPGGLLLHNLVELG